MSHPDVLIVGGGPAGVAAALAARAAGAGRVILLEREPRLGGATRHCSHSPFGMLERGRVYFGAAWGARLERDAREAGVEVLTGHSVTALGADGTVEVSHAGGVGGFAARRILLATGARELSRAQRLLPGDRPVGIVTTGALQASLAFHGLLPFRRPVILGSELVSHSAVVSCLAHGARPVAMLETGPARLARAPVTWLPALTGIPVRSGVRIVDIIGRSRVEAIRFEYRGRIETLACDGLLLTGRFTPEAALLWQSGQRINRGSGGPSVDQHGRCANPLYFAAGNLLRPIETGGWSFREGRAIGHALALDLQRPVPEGEAVAVRYDDPVRLVVPDLVRPGVAPAPGFNRFQLRFARDCRGRLALEVDGRTLWQRSGRWRPERRVLVPMPAGIEHAGQIAFRLSEAPDSSEAPVFSED